MNLAFDIDGLADSAPRVVQSMMSAFTAAGFHNYVISGVEAPVATKADVEAKKGYLTSLGITSDLYVELIVCPKPHPKNKAKAIKEHDIAVLFDNSVANCQKAKKLCLAFLLVNAEVK